MSLADYEASKRLMAADPPFYAIIICAMATANEDDKLVLARLYGAQTGSRPFEQDTAQAMLNNVPNMTFEAWIMAAIRRADTDNNEHLRTHWPVIHRELVARYNSPGGYIPGVDY